MNSNEDWYQSAIFEYKINEITEHFVNKDLIGKGSFSLVYKTKCESLEGIVVAIKEVNIISNDYNSLKTFITELKIYNRINNKRIIQFYGISRNAEKKLYYLVLEYANQGNLREFINEKNRNENDFEWKERVNLATQIAEGLCYLHKLNIAHRDLHTKNILINDGNIKISDFGLSKDLESTMSSGGKFFGVLPFIDPHKLKHRHVSLDKRSDVYSLGMVLWEISSCRKPFHNYKEELNLYLDICQGLKEEFIKGTPEGYINIYANCWQSEPESRPLIDQVHLQLQSISLKPIFEGSNNPISIDTEKEKTPIGIISTPDSPIYDSNLLCKICGMQFKNYYWCHECEAQAFRKNFPNWTSENKELDEIIQSSQLDATRYDKYFEWIDYDRFKKIEFIIQGSYCKIYIATWLDGIREKWDNESRQWLRTGPVQIILREFRSKSTIKNLKLHLEFENAICCYGFTQNPETKCYYMVLKYANCGNFREYLWKNFPCNWLKRLSILQKIVENLNNIHKKNYIHRDLYPGNILIQEDNREDNWEQHNVEVYNSELDSCANLKSLIEQQQYGNLPYVAPEVIVGNGNITSIKSDIYSIGIIMWELASGDEPYSDREIDNEDELILDIINGVRPNDVIGTPKCYYDLMQKCLDADPEKRPTTLELLEELKTFISIPLKKHQFEAANFKRRSQPLGARPNQLSKDNVEIFVESISVIEAYKTCFRFTNKPLQLDFILSEPKNASEKSLYFNDQGLLECQLKRIDL
ncbi:kinase-like protein [Rhizophagus irregularis]|uniref:Kinase-like protein n=2 Tax=Rhizophagus irregularis TaxID=588596 RepID=A0A2N0S7G8_9GLOM|nr:kinase-like protein [Rhizophagus irregularis]